MSLKTIVVFDTSVLVSAALKEKSLVATAFKKAVREFQLIASDSTFAECVSVLSRSKFDPYVSVAVRAKFITNMQLATHMITVTPQLDICRDVKDNKFLDLAVQGHASYIITGDNDLLILDPFHDIRIVSPADFMAITS